MENNTMLTVIDKPKNLPAEPETELDNIRRAAEADAGFEKRLKFKKGKYFIGDDEVPLGRQYVAHATQWTKRWVKYLDGKKVDERMGKVADGFRPPPREDLGDNDRSKWELGDDGQPKNPWNLEFLVPMEDLENGDVAIFTTTSVGGQRAVADLCRAFARHAQKGRRTLPIVKLATVDMPTKAYGPVPRPEFEITGWDNEMAAGNVEVISPSVADDLDDEIPF
jgi:hypothetical protein